jgi:hypothetical protein
MLNDVKHLKNAQHNNLLMYYTLDFMNFQSCIFLFYFAYLAYYGAKNEKVKEFLYDTFCYVDEFLKNRDLLNDASDEEEEDNEQEKEKKTPVQPKRFEDKYLEAYKKIEPIELTKEQLDGLKNTMIMESTPIGNVVMFYDNQTENFVYHSDLTMPYRYLEVIGRKYVTTFKCKNIFIDMNEELKTAEEKKVNKTQVENKVPFDNNNASFQSDKNKKDVFAKFKTYNNNVSKEVAAAPSKNNGPTDTKKENDNMLLKEKANRYRYEGKLANLKFLQQVDKKKNR